MDRTILKIKKYFWSILFITGSFLFLIVSLKAYSPTPTHTALVEASVKLYNQFNQEKITEQEMEWLRQGDIEEDVSPRWLNHFYDPTTGKGWIGEGLMVDGKEMSPELVLKGQSLLIGGQGAAAPDWANNHELQTSYDKYLGDQTFDRAVYEYAHGNKKSAFIALGHVFHLIQDMTVPAHTRQDTHADAVLDDGDSYESWLNALSHSAVENFNEIINEYLSFKCLDLKNCFEQIAQYSNQYFFSKDTINKKYSNPKILYSKIETIDGKGYKFGYGKDENNKDFRLALYKGDAPIIDKEAFIHQDYWSRLSKKAVMGGAEVLRLFKEEVIKAEAIQQSGQEYTQGEPLADKPKYNLYTGSYAFVPPGQFFSPLGELLKFKDKTDKFKNFVGNLIIKAVFPISSVASFIQEQIATRHVQENTISGAIATLLNRAPAEEPLAKSEEVNLLLPPPPVLISSPPVLIPPSVSVPPTGEAGPSASSVGGEPAKEIIHAPYQPPTTESSRLPQMASPAVSSNFENSENSGPEILSSQPDQPIATSGPAAAGLLAGEPIYQSDPGAALPPWLSYGTPPPTPSPSPPSPDLTHPDIEISLKNYKVTSMNFTVVWNSSSTDLSFYEVQYQEGNSQTWTDWVSNSLMAEKSFEAEKDDTIYYFRARATDFAGNPSQWREISAEICTKPVVINEIAWMGTGASSQLNKDEWIELYNKSDLNINLDGWTLVSSDNGGPDISFASTSVILAKGYFLIERTDDETVSGDGMLADWFGSFGNGLNDDGEVLELKDGQGNIIDQVGAENEEWYAGDKTSRATMERINPWLAGTIAENWQTNNLLIKNGLAADNETKINGTPKQQNSVFNQNYSVPPYTWSKPKIIMSQWSPAGVGAPSIVADDQNYPWLIWNYTRTFGFVDVVYNFFNGASWLKEPKYLTDNNLRGKVASPAPSLVRDNSNKFKAIFSATENNSLRSLYFSQFEDNNWSNPVRLSNASTSAYYSSMAIDSQNRIHVVWETDSSDRQIFYRFYDYSNGWSNIFRVSSSSEIVYSPKIVVDKNDQPHLFWFEYKKPAGIIGNGLFYSTLISNQWAEPVKILDYNGIGIIHPDSSSIAIDQNNKIHLVFSDKRGSDSQGEIYYSFSADGVWSEPINLSNSPSSQSRLPQIALDNQNKIHLVWAETVNNKEQVFYSRFGSTGLAPEAERAGSPQDENNSWTTPVNVFSDPSKNFSYPKLAIDSVDKLHLAWTNWGSEPGSIYYSTAKSPLEGGNP